MNLPKSFFEPGTYNLTGSAKSSIKAFLKKQELSQFNSLVGYTPHPENPCPPPRWPWPVPRRYSFNAQSNINKIGPPWPEPSLNFEAFNSNSMNMDYPDPDDPNPWPWPFGPLIKDLLSERIYELINKAPLKSNTYNFIDVIKRERIAIEALNELKDGLSEAQNTIAIKMKSMISKKHNY